MAGFNIKNFKAAIEGNKGFLKNNSFLVEFPKPKGLDSSSNKELQFYCKSAPLPGIGILTSDTHQYGIGPIERKPYGTVVNDAMMHFYLDASGKVRNFFYDWINLIANPQSYKGMTGASRTGADPYEISYKVDYAVDLTVTSYTPEGNTSTKIALIEAYPNYVGDTVMDWGDKNTIMMLPISFTYRDWYRLDQQ